MGWTAGKQRGSGEESVSARALFDPSCPLPPPLSPTTWQAPCYRHREFGTRLWEGYREGQGNTRPNTGRRPEPRVREGPSRDKLDWEIMLPLAARETEAQKGTRSMRNGFLILTPCLALTLAFPSTRVSYVSPGVGHCGKYCFQSPAAESSFLEARPGHLHF